ncbi:hypothetical protein lerEdw1_018439 [Lerista edwardsae]|nr:hypothetical protein lerEdw1_018439 [Lerista edwardsae]
MGKEKKKESKKEKAAPPPVHDAPLELASSTSYDQTAAHLDEQQANAVASQEDQKDHEELPAAEPIEYEEPILTQLIVESYEGAKVHGLYEGEGTAHFQGDNVYTGMFSEGLMHGHGAYTWADGLKYEGNFVKNVPMYHGAYTWPDGSVYEGEVKNGIRHGFGMFKCGTYPVSYIGHWFEGKRHGKGTIYYNREGTSWYEGDFVYNIKSGWGIRCYKSGNIYEGQWDRDLRHGEGRMRWLISNQEYTGQWVDGIQGKLVFKNGRVYEGEFVHDRLAEFPAFQIDDSNMENLSNICTKNPFLADSIRVVDGTNLSGQGSSIEIDISTLLAIFPEKDREEEIKQTEFAVLRHISELRRIYTFYSSLGYDRSLDNTFLMTKLQFWRFLKDCLLHYCNLTLADMDRILNDKSLLEEIHSPYETLLLRMFLTYLIYLAFHIYHKEFGDRSPRLFKCFSKLMTEKILPNACHIRGVLFTDRQQTVYAINYIDKCWEIYKTFCRPSAVSPYEPTMKMRHFLWMMKDLRLISKQLTATKIVDILAKDSPCVRNGEDTILEFELVFLEFFDALLDCALLYVTDDMLKQQVERATKSQTSYRSSDYPDGAKLTSLHPELSSGQKGKAKEGGKEDKASRSSSKSSGKGKETPSQANVNVTLIPVVTLVSDKEEASIQTLSSYEAEPEEILSAPMRQLAEKLETAIYEQKDKLGMWMSRIYIFLVKKFFVSNRHLEIVKETVLDNRIREAEMVVLRKIQEEEEEAKLAAMKEAEEARKLEEALAAAEKAAQELEESMIREQEEGPVPKESPPKEESPISPQAAPSSKTTTGGKKKKKA